jgi:hypothetical protein
MFHTDFFDKGRKAVIIFGVHDIFWKQLIIRKTLGSFI